MKNNTEAKGHHHGNGCCGHHHEEDHGCCGHHHEEDHGCCGHHHEEEHGCCGHHHEEGCCEDHDDEEDHHCEEHCDKAKKQGYEIEEFISETSKQYSRDELINIIHSLDKCGEILEAKGLVRNIDGTWLKFNYISRECEIRVVESDDSGYFEVRGADLDGRKIAELFKV